MARVLHCITYQNQYVIVAEKLIVIFLHGTCTTFAIFIYARNDVSFFRCFALHFLTSFFFVVICIANIEA